MTCPAWLAITCVTLMAMVAACGEKPVGPPPQKTGPLSIVSINPMVHELVQKLVPDHMEARCLLNTPMALRHGDLPADGAVILREADVVFMHAAEPFADVVKTIEGNVAADSLIRLGEHRLDTATKNSSRLISFAPDDVLALLNEIETLLMRIKPHEATIRQEAAKLRSSIEALSSSMQTQLASLPADRRIILTDDVAVAAVIRSIGFEAVQLERSIGVHPTVADREALLNQIRIAKVGAMAMDDGGSETMREMLAEVAKTTGAKVIYPSIQAWPVEGEGYVAWMQRTVDAVLKAMR